MRLFAVLKFILLLLPGLCCLCSVSDAARRPAVQKSAALKERIALREDKRQLSYGGKDLVLLSGNMQYFRIPKEQWAEQLKLCQQAGLNCIETCVPWNYHQPQWQQAPLLRTRELQLQELADFLDMVHAAGLNSFVRIGPYVGAELAGGGLPEWLEQSSAGPERFAAHLLWRSAEASNLAAASAWLEALIKVLKPRQLGSSRARGGCVMVQIEQEYDFVELPAEQKRLYLQALVSQLREGGLVLPINTALGREMLNVHDPLQLNINTLNLYDRLDLDSSRRKLSEFAAARPERPLLVSELQTGWYTRVGGQLAQKQPGIALDQLQGLVWSCLQQGAAGYNYSQFVAGSNFGSLAGRGIAQSYDCYAPISEGAFITDKYVWLQALHAWYREHDYNMFATTAADYKLADKPEQLLLSLRRASGGDYYVFVHNKHAQRGLKYRLELEIGKGCSLSWDLQLAAKAHEILRVPALAGTKSPQKVIAGEHDGVYAQLQKKLQKKLPQLEISRKTLPLRGLQQLALSHQQLQQLPQNQFKSVAGNMHLQQMGLYNQKAILYRADFELDKSSAAAYQQVSLRLFAAARLQLWLNGRPLEAAASDAAHRCWNLDGHAAEGKNRLLILMECPSQGYWGDELLQKSGIYDLCLLAAQPRIDLADWHVQKLGCAGEAEGLLDEDFSRWPRYRLDRDNLARLGNTQITAKQLGELAPLRELWEPDACAMYACEFNLSERQLEQELHWLNFGSLDDMAVVYLNGRKIAQNSRWDVALRCNVAGLLKKQGNRLQVCVLNAGGKGGMLGSVYFDGNLPAASMPLGMQVAAEQSELGLLDSAQNRRSADWLDYLPLNSSSADQPRNYLAHSPVVYYRATFATPEKFSGRQRLLLKLQTQGNGEIYLNGKTLGRFWRIGPQQYYLLPGCWLRRDKGDNELILSSRAGSDGNELLDVSLLLQWQAYGR